ncbi:MAG: hypothetical protein Q7P63_02080 [Verrucomicrobiota bacterium JB022]|nr:hypothetical protein [Verrucomicrobiota bacterium JB022]
MFGLEFIPIILLIALVFLVVLIRPWKKKERVGHKPPRANETVLSKEEKHHERQTNAPPLDESGQVKS